MTITSAPADEGLMPKRKKPTTSKKRRAPSAPQFTMRVNILLTQEQYVKLLEWARAEGRPLPNLIRRLIDVSITRRE
jgi:hypothetical protein